MAHLSVGFFPLSPPPKLKPSPLSRTPSPLSWTTAPSTTATTLTSLPSLPFHLFSPVAHQWFFSAAPLACVKGDVVGVGLEEEERGEVGPRRSRLIAQNIPWSYTCEDVKGIFERHGIVVDVELSMHNSTRNRGLAFVTMSSEEAAEEALNNLNLQELDGRVIKVEYARSVKRSHSAPPSPSPSQKFNVFVGNLTYKVRSRDLKELFKAFNPNVLSAEVIFQSNPRRSAGYGFASFASKEEAEAATSALSGKKLMGRAIRLALARKDVEDPQVQLNEDAQIDEKLADMIRS